MPPILMLLIIVGLAITATMLYTNETQKVKNDAAQEKAALQNQNSLKGPVVYATKDIPEGTPITADALEQREELQSKIPAGAMTSTSAGVGSVAAYSIKTGDIVLLNAAKVSLAQVGFEGKIKEGFRAVTFAVTPEVGVGGFISPGAHVDILCIAGTAGDTKAAPVLSDVEVIAAGSTYKKAPGETQAQQATNMTVLVSPKDAEKLVKAVTAGKLYLTLRNEKDHSPVATVDITALFPKPVKVEEGAELASKEAAPQLPPPPVPGGPTGGSEAGTPPPPPPPPMQEIELWSGSHKEVLQVPKG